MVYHIFIDNSISETKIKEEIQFLSYLFCKEAWYATKIKKSGKAFFGMTAEQALLKFQMLTNSTVLLDPLESTPLSKMKLPYTVEDYIDWVQGACDAITIHPTNLVQMDDLREKILSHDVTAGAMIVASNNVRYGAYKDYSCLKYISKDGVSPEILLRKAIVYVLNVWFGYIAGSDPEQKKAIENIRRRIVSAYLLGATR